jgi:hypothetical protein
LAANSGSPSSTARIATSQSSPGSTAFCVAKDAIRQFVAMPLGSGYSVEEQITGKPEHGGLQIIVYPMRKERYEALSRRRERALLHHTGAAGSHMLLRRTAEPARAMGLAAGGRMRQQIYADPHGLDAWDVNIEPLFRNSGRRRTVARDHRRGTSDKAADRGRLHQSRACRGSITMPPISRHLAARRRWHSSRVWPRLHRRRVSRCWAPTTR